MLAPDSSEKICGDDAGKRVVQSEMFVIGVGIRVMQSEFEYEIWWLPMKRGPHFPRANQSYSSRCALLILLAETIGM